MFYPTVVFTIYSVDSLSVGRFRVIAPVVRDVPSATRLMPMAAISIPKPGMNRDITILADPARIAMIPRDAI